MPCALPTDFPTLITQSSGHTLQPSPTTTLTNHPRTWVTRPIVLRGHQYRRPGTDMEPEPLNASSDSFIDEEDDQAEVSRWLWLDRTNL